MRIGGLDIASSTGLTVHDTETDEWFPSSFKPKAKRPFGLKNGEVDFGHEGAIAHEFRDHLHAWLLAEDITVVGIEKPLVPNLTRKKPIYNTQANWAGQAVSYETTGGTNFGTIFRIYMLVGHAVELCARMNIPVHVFSQGEWRSDFMGTTRAPKGTSNGSAWLKNKAKERCELLKIPVKNADQADSVGVCWHLRTRLSPHKPRVGQLALEVFGNG